MYEELYGFREKPFSLLPDPEYLYLSAKHSSAYSVLEYGLTGQAGFTIITGDVGSGKTTLVHSFLDQVDADTTVGLVSNTPRSFGNLLQWILYAFNLEYHGKETVQLYQGLTDFLAAQHDAGRRSMLIIDEAQNLDPETLEELRMLSNINASKNLLLQIVLVGQPELVDTLNRPDLRQFTQRIAISYQLTALTLEETHAYIRHRLTVAGGDPMIFTGAACDAVYHLSKGVPRLINSLCDLSLVYGYGDGVRRINMETVLSVFEDRSRSGLGMGTNAPSREQLTEEIRRLEMERAEIVDDGRGTGDAPPGRGAELVELGSEGRDASPVHVPDASDHREDTPLDYVDDGQADAIASALADAPADAKFNSRPAGHPDTGRQKGAAPRPAAPHTATPEKALPMAFTPDFLGSRRQPAAQRQARSTRFRWVLVFAVLAALLLVLWQISASP